jgi:hypothetical protein
MVGMVTTSTHLFHNGSQNENGEWKVGCPFEVWKSIIFLMDNDLINMSPRSTCMHHRGH